MIDFVVLSHKNSQKYTDGIVKKVPSVNVYHSHLHKTPFTVSFNNALQNSSAEWVAPINNDINIDQRHVDILNKTVASLLPGIYSPKVNSPHHHMHANLTDEAILFTKWIELVCPIIHKNVIEKVGLLDESMPLGYGVDYDYGYRARRYNFRVGVLQNVKVHHYEHRSQDNHIKYRDEASKEMNAALSKKYGKNWRLRLL